MLCSRKITATLTGETLEGCPQEGCSIAPAVDVLIRGLNKNSCYTLGYPNDITIPISGKFLNTISELLQEALGMVQ
jgi:hypothetical protein